MTRTNSRGQAALEFIMTYGWAILAVLVIIGALAYFGVLSPGRFTPDKCFTATGVSCIDYRLAHSGTADLNIDVTFENSMGEPMNVTEIYAKSSRGSDIDCFGAATIVPAGDRFSTASCTISGGSPGRGQKDKVDLEVSYRKLQGGVYSHNVSVQVQTEVQ
jgi:hypothetical protein